MTVNVMNMSKVNLMPTEVDIQNYSMSVRTLSMYLLMSYMNLGTLYTYTKHDIGYKLLWTFLLDKNIPRQT